MACFLNGRIASGIDALLDLMKFDDLVKTADLIVTGEGSVDGQTAGGKAVQGIARRAAGKPVIVLSGSAKLDPASWEKLRASGVAADVPDRAGTLHTGRSDGEGLGKSARHSAQCLFAP